MLPPSTRGMLELDKANYNHEGSGCSLNDMKWWEPLPGKVYPIDSVASASGLALQNALAESARILEGRKDDQDKPRLDLIAPEIQTALGEILAFGAKKYDARNWEKGMSWGRVYGALMRHLWAWWAREDKDRETGKSHLWHAACCIMFLVAYEARGVGVDDRA